MPIKEVVIIRDCPPVNTISKKNYGLDLWNFVENNPGTMRSVTFQVIWTQGQVYELEIKKKKWFLLASNPFNIVVQSRQTIKIIWSNFRIFMILWA